MDSSPDRQALEALIRQKRAQRREASRIRKRPEGIRIPLSYGQERLWFLEQYSPDSQTYNRPTHIRLKGALDIPALQHTLNAVIRRHESLRTRFLPGAKDPEQVIQQDLTITLPLKKLDSNKVQEMQELVRQETFEPFDLSTGPLVRAKLIRLSKQEHLLLLTFHHIIFDGWSQSILHRELSSHYQHFSQGKHYDPPPLAVHYADFALWQRQFLESGCLNAAITYWKNQLNDCPAYLDLPTDRPRPRIQSYRGARHSLEFSRELWMQIKALSRQNNTTVFITLFTALFALLYRYSGQKDIAIGFPISSRHQPATEELIGFFINTLVLRADLSGNPTFEALLKRVHQLAMEAYKHQGLPFENLVQQLEIERDLSRSPLFQVFFQFRNYPKEVLELPGLEAERYEFESPVEKFDLFLDTIENQDTLCCTFRYNVDLFDEATIVQMAMHFQKIVEAAVSNPPQPIALWDLLSKEEKQLICIDWNDTEEQGLNSLCIHEWFEEQVEKKPDKVAVSYEGTNLTYQQLNEQANFLAHFLIEEGIQTGSQVALFIEPSTAMMAGLLGILKAGVAFVPLDPELPQERVQRLLNDVEAVVTNSQLIHLLPETKATVIDLDTLSGSNNENNSHNPSQANDQDGLAYVIYTSGSTGQPKGVMIEHAAFSNLLSAMGKTPGFTEEDTLFSIINLSFDIGVLEVLLPICLGGTLELMPRGTARDADALISKLARSKATLMMATPATWRMLLDSEWPGKEGLTLINGGEALPEDVARKLLRKGYTLWNLYGPTETTVYSTAAELKRGFEVVTIGKPILNTRCYVLDPFDQLTPPGIPGELCIGGAGLARGYFNQPKLTAQSFKIHSLPDQAEERLYHTGDLVRWRRSGDLEFLGRLDHQLKIRGFRIEPGDIESTLKKHPVVKDCLVVGREETPGDLRLVAYVVPENNLKADESVVADASWSEWQTEQVSQWESIWDQTFSAPPAAPDPTCNTAGVVSSYTGELIPANEARNWVEHAAKRVLKLKPDKVLDVGCGLGRTLFRVAPHCSKYWGVDFSQPALDYVEQHLHLLQSGPDDIRLLSASADRINQLPDKDFDLVIINGVVMYFPSMYYLVDVIEQSLEIVSPGGQVFIGDVRSLPLLEAFKLSVILHDTAADEPVDEVYEKVNQRVLAEEELLVDPEFFRALPNHYPEIQSVDMQLKRGWPLNELTRFRYDVVLNLKKHSQQATAAVCYDWEKDSMHLEQIRECLSEQHSKTLKIRNVPNSRVHPEVAALKELELKANTLSAGELKGRLESERAEAPNPEAFWQLAEEMNCEASITFPTEGGPGYFNATFRKSNSASSQDRNPVPSQARHRTGTTDWNFQGFGNNPLHAKLNKFLTPVLRSLAESQLPQYMVPSNFVFLNEFPLTRNGKIDRKKLPSPQAARTAPDSSLPQTALEKTIAEIWSDVLQVDNIGVNDNFFELGGHSLSVTQVINRLKRKLNKPPSLILIFEAPTIEALAQNLQRKGIGLQEE